MDISIVLTDSNVKYYSSHAISTGHLASFVNLMLGFGNWGKKNSSNLDLAGDKMARWEDREELRELMTKWNPLQRPWHHTPWPPQTCNTPSYGHAPSESWPLPIRITIDEPWPHADHVPTVHLRPSRARVTRCLSALVGVRRTTGVRDWASGASELGRG